MTYDRYQIELGVLQNSTIKSKQYKFMDNGHAVSVFGGRHSD